MAHDANLQGRIRTLLAGRPDVEEKRMVGGMSFVVGGHLCVGVKGDALLVRVGPAAVRSDESFRGWVDRGLAFVASQPTPRARSIR